MSDQAILGQVALGYSPFIDRNRAVTATRLTVFPLRPDAVLDVGQLLHEVGNVWPATGARVSLNVVSETLLQGLMLAQPSANLMVEVPAFMAVDPVNVDALVALHANGSTLLLKVMDRFPIIITLGAALLGFLAGEMLLTDPAVVARFGEPSHAAINAAGAVGAAIVVATGLWMQRRARERSQEKSRDKSPA